MRALSLPVLNHAGRLAFLNLAGSGTVAIAPLKAIYHFNKIILLLMLQGALFLAPQNSLLKSDARISRIY